VGVGDGLAQCPPAVVVLVEGGVWLVAGRVFVRGVDDAAVERPPGQVGVGDELGEPVGVGVESDGDDAVDLGDALAESVEEHWRL
jgi:hypothetical protein